MNLTRLLQMSPAEIATRAQQAFSKRWSRSASLPANPIHRDPRLPGLAPACVARSKPRRSAGTASTCSATKISISASPIDWHFDPVHGKRAPRKTVAPNPVPRLRSSRRSQNHLGAEPPPAPRHTGASRFPRRNSGPMDALAKRKPLPHRHQLGQHAGGRLPRAVLALGPPLHRRFSPGPDSPRCTCTAGISSAFSPLTFLPTPTCSAKAWRSSPSARCARKSPKRAAGKRAAGKSSCEQAETQVRPDGFHFEQSVYYHVYALDFFQFARDLAAINAVPIPPSFDRTIEKMSEALAALSQAGRPPNFGDDDGGRVIVSPPRLARPLARSDP